MVFWSELRLRNQFGQRAKVMANDLRPIALTHRRNRHLCHHLNLKTLFSTWFRLIYGMEGRLPLQHTDDIFRHQTHPF